ncbi:MAG: tRNA (adenosine(37)-N6)-dimethylallyltransferase MiaA [Rhodocyclaceae bacterium]|nr:tRNA (adenosine(37)-N6)-dimethylallyltransferase MiaA [Rhodocyclaceae bacterium]
MGPTASGKTALTLELAKRFPVEVVSVDSALVYRDMDIGTAKPTPAERAACPHHLIDVISPEEAYSAARFREDAVRLMREISGRGRIPVLAGGTMLYFKALREGLSNLPAADAGLRAEIEEDAARRGWPALHADLARLDPEAAARLKPGDSQRIQRALEIVRLTGQPLAEAYASRDGEGELPCRLVALGLLPSDRAALHQRIGARFEAMLAEGLVAEVEGLRQKYRLNASLPAMRCVGYRQVWEMLEGELPPAELRDRGVFATRQLAKRQMTWLRGFSGIHFLDCLDPSLVDRAATWCAREIASP